MTEAEKLYERLRPLQEKKGYFFNSDMECTLGILEGLLVNRQRYGYMSCPCRMASGDREHDHDICCPCDYREPDVKEFGSCYCGLYVSREWLDDATLHVYVPERRPAEKYK
jgi:ferredoxin-thioredoxin reductase catalytic subunit